MFYCSHCLLPSTAPGFSADENGVCHQCRAFFSYSSNTNEYTVAVPPLHEVLSKLMLRPARDFDCVLGVSGGKDSTTQAVWLRDNTELRPLLVSMVGPPAHLTDLGAANLSNLVNLGFEAEIIYPAPVDYQSLCKAAFIEFGNYAIASEMALYASSIRVALERDIQVIFNGENPALRDQNTFDSGSLWRYQRLAEQRTLRQATIEELCTFSNLSLHKSSIYKIPSTSQLESSQIHIIDLAYFIPKWDNFNNAYRAILNGFDFYETNPLDTGDLEGVSALDDPFVPVNQMLKYYKFGFGKVCDYVNEAIRLQRISREKGVDLVVRYDGKCSSAVVEAFCTYLEMSESEFWRVVRRFVNSDIFEVPREDEGPIIPKFQVGQATSKIPQLNPV